MIDREKILKGLECCSDPDGYKCNQCPYETECHTEILSGINHLCAEALELLNSRPEQKYGHWITDTKSYTGRVYCSECNELAPLEIKSYDYYGRSSYGEWTKTKYCPNCGAKMEAKQE